MNVFLLDDQSLLEPGETDGIRIIISIVNFIIIVGMCSTFDERDESGLFPESIK